MNEGNEFKKSRASYSLIIYALTLFILFIEAIYTLLRIFRRGILKKETLSKNSNIGFDVKIIMK